MVKISMYKNAAGALLVIWRTAKGNLIGEVFYDGIEKRGRWGSRGTFEGDEATEYRVCEYYGFDSSKAWWRRFDEEPKPKPTIWLFTQESNVDGEIIFNVIPCKDKETAKKLMNQEVSTLLNESHHYSGYCDSEFEESFEIEKTDESYFINDRTDDYYEDLKIFEKEIR